VALSFLNGCRVEASGKCREPGDGVAHAGNFAALHSVTGLKIVVRPEAMQGRGRNRSGRVRLPADRGACGQMEPIRPVRRAGERYVCHVVAPDEWEPNLDWEHDDHRWCKPREGFRTLRWPATAQALWEFPIREAN
jgi:hypothetical protein